VGGALVIYANICIVVKIKWQITDKHIYSIRFTVSRIIIQFVALNHICVLFVFLYF